jgi:predicted adenylyl cyclase CyaB
VSNIEVEVRSLLNKKQYDSLKHRMNKEAKMLDSFCDETIYFTSDGNIRLRRDDKFTYIIVKGDKLHDYYREERQWKFDRNQFNKLKEIIESFGHIPVVGWRRKRIIYKWKGEKLFLDDTEGYYKIVEIERVTYKKDKNQALKELKNKLKILGLKPASKAKINKKFQEYKSRWQKISRE